MRTVTTTKTATKTVTQTQMMFAITAAALATGWAYIVAPLNVPQNHEVKSHVLSVSLKEKCQSGTYKVAEIVCKDGTQIPLQSGEECLTPQEWVSQGQLICNK